MKFPQFPSITRIIESAPTMRAADLMSNFMTDNIMLVFEVDSLTESEIKGLERVIMIDFIDNKWIPEDAALEHGLQAPNN